MEDVTLYRQFTACMAAFLRGEAAPPLSLSAPVWGKLYALAKRQGLAGALFIVTERHEMPASVSDRLRRQGFLTLARAEEQYCACDEMAQTLSDKAIPHLFFKGAVVRRYYPDPAMRSMGDIDVAVREEDRRRADAVMTALGYACSSKSTEVWVYQRDALMVEVHTVVRRFDVKKQEPIVYEALWTDARLQKEQTFHLSDDAEIAHAVHHLAAHFSAGGCGLRQVMDVAVLYTHFDDEALWDAVLERLEKERLADFTRRLLWLCDAWCLAAVRDAHKEAVPAEFEESMLVRLLCDGTFGKDERVLLSARRREERAAEDEPRGGMRRRLFPSVDVVKRRYGYVQKHPWLLPIGYLHRAGQGLTKNRRIHQKRRAYAAEHETELAAEIALFDAMGL